VSQLLGRIKKHIEYVLKSIGTVKVPILFETVNDKLQYQICCDFSISLVSFIQSVVGMQRRILAPMEIIEPLKFDRLSRRSLRQSDPPSDSVRLLSSA